MYMFLAIIGGHAYADAHASLRCDFNPTAVFIRAAELEGYLDHAVLNHSA
jgi:hypothetical protein